MEALAKSTSRNGSHLAADAIRICLDVQEWQVDGMLSVERSLEENGSVGHGYVKSWVGSWDEKGETQRPKPRGR